MCSNCLVILYLSCAVTSSCSPSQLDEVGSVETSAVDVRTSPGGILNRSKAMRLIAMPQMESSVINEELKRKLNRRQCNYRG